MDLSKLSDNDLRALKANNFSALSDEGLIFLKQATAPQLTPEERAERQGFGAAFGESFGQFGTAAMRGIGETFDIESLTEAAKAREAQARAEPGFIPTTEEDVTKAFEEGILPGVGAGFRQFVSEPAGELAGQFIAPAAVGLGTATLAPKLGLAGLGAYALTGATTALSELPTAVGETIQRMEQEGQEVDENRALAFAIPQAVLYGFGLPGVGALPRAAQRIFKSQGDRVAERVLAGEITKEQGIQELSGYLSSIAKQTALAGASGAAVVTGAEALKRSAAGQGLTDEEAVDAYLDQALAAGALAPFFGGPLGVGRRMGAVRDVKQAGATREAEVAAQRRAEEETAAAQADGMLFRPDEFETAGPPTRPVDTRPNELAALREQIAEATAAGDLATVDALTKRAQRLEDDLQVAGGFSRVDLTYKEQMLNGRLDDIRERIEEATQAGDFARVQELSNLSNTIRQEIKGTQDQLEKMGGPIRSVEEIQKQFDSRTKALQKAAAEGDTEKVGKLIPEIRQLEAELAQTREATMPADDLFARADRAEAEQAERVGRLDDELAQQTEAFEQIVERSRQESDDTLARLQDELERIPDVGLVGRMEDILARAALNNQNRFATTTDDVARQEVARNQEQLEALRRDLAAATSADDVVAVERIRGELAQLLTQARRSRPTVLRENAVTDQRAAVETVRSNLEDLVTRQFEGSGARDAETTGVTRQSLATDIKNAIASYADAAVREVNATRRDNRQQPLTNTEAARLAMDVRGRLEAVVGQGNLKALELAKDGSSPIERQLAQLKQPYLRGEPTRQRAPFQLQQQQDVLEAIRQEEALPAQTRRLTADRQRAALERRLKNISKKITEEVGGQVPAFNMDRIRALQREYSNIEQRLRDGTRATDDRLAALRRNLERTQREEAANRAAEELPLLEQRLEAVRNQRKPEDVIRELDQRIEQARQFRSNDVEAIKKNDEKLANLRAQRAEATSQIEPYQNTLRQLEQDVARTRELARSVETPTNQAQRIAELEAQLSAVRAQASPDPAVIKQLEDEIARTRREGVPVARAPEQSQPQLFSTTDLEKLTELNRRVEEGRQPSLFGADELEPTATLRATPQNFMRFLRSGNVQKLRAKLDRDEQGFIDVKKFIRQGTQEALEQAQLRLGEIRKAITGAEQSLQKAWENSPAKAQKKVEAAERNLNTLQASVLNKSRRVGQEGTRIIQEKSDLRETIATLDRALKAGSVSDEVKQRALRRQDKRDELLATRQNLNRQIRELRKAPASEARDLRLDRLQERAESLRQRYLNTRLNEEDAAIVAREKVKDTLENEYRAKVQREGAAEPPTDKTINARLNDKKAEAMTEMAELDSLRKQLTDEVVADRARVELAEKELEVARAVAEEVAENRPADLKALDKMRKSLQDPIARLREEQSRLEKEIADRLETLEKKAVTEKRPPEEIERIAQAAATARAQAGATEASLKKAKTEARDAEAKAEQARMEEAGRRERRVTTTAREPVGVKRVEAQIKEDRAAIREEKKKDTPDTDKIKALEARVEKNRARSKYLRAKATLRTELDKPTRADIETEKDADTKKQLSKMPVRNEKKVRELESQIEQYEKEFGGPTELAEKIKTTTVTRPKSQTEIDAEQRERQADVADQLRGRKEPPSIGVADRQIKAAEEAKAAVQKEYDRVLEKVAKAKDAVDARKTQKGKATASRELQKVRAERASVEAKLREANKKLNEANKRYAAAVAQAKKDSQEAGKFSPDELRKSLTRLEKENRKIVSDLNKAKKALADAKTDKQKAELQKKVGTLQQELSANNTAREFKGQELDRAESTLARLGERAARSQRTAPLRVSAQETGRKLGEVYDPNADYTKFLEEKGLNWRTIDDVESPDGTVLRAYASDGKKIDSAEAADVGRTLESDIPSGIDFQSVGFFSDLPADVKRHFQETFGLDEFSPTVENIRGFVMPDGRVFVIRNNHTSRIDLETTYAHELIGHVATDRLLGREGMKRLSARVEAMPGGAYGLARELGIENEFRGSMADQALTIKKMKDSGATKAQIDKALGEMEVSATRELLAYTAEKRVSENLKQKLGRWYREIIGAFRDWMRRTGMAELAKVTDADIYNIIRKAQKAYKRDELGAHRNINGDVAFRKSASMPNPGIDPAVASGVGKVVPQEKGWLDGIKASAMGMQFMHRFVDRFAGLEYIARTAPAFKGSLEGVQMQYYNRIYDQRNNMTANIASNGPVRLVKNQKEGTFEYKSTNAPSLKSIFETLKSAQKDFGNERFTVDTFGTYLAVERAASDPKGLAEGLKKLDLSGKLSMAEAQALLKTGRGNEAFQKARSMYREYNNGLIGLLEDTGRISKEEAARFRKGDYVPYYRERNGEIWDVEHNVRVGDIKNQPMLRQLVGGDSAIVNFEVGALQNTYLLTEMALGNVSTKNTAYTLQTLGIADVRKGDGGAGPNVIRFFENGEKKHAVLATKGEALRLENELAEMRQKGLAGTERYKKKAARADRARESETLFGDIPAELIVKGMEGISLELPMAIKFMQAPANLLRKAVTRNPAYAARIAIKDSVYGWVATGSDVKPVLGVLGNIKGAWTGEKPAIKKLQEQGIIGGHVFNGTVEDMRTVALQISRGEKGWEKLMAKADRLAILADEAARVTLYDGFIKKGMTEMEATLATLEAQNFTKHGMSPSVRYMSTMIPFFNAQIQGLNVFARALAGKTLFEDKIGVRAAALQRGGMIAGGTMLYSILMADNEAYKNATQDQRMNYWFVPLPFFDEPIRVPIPFEAGLVFKALPEGIINMAQKDKDASDVLDALGKLTLAAIPGSSNLFLPQGVKPLIEVATNTSFYGMRPIEGLRAQQEQPGYRFGSRTTEVSKAIGETLGISPLKIDSLINGYTSSTGIALLSVFNPILRDTDPATLKTSEFAIVGGFFQPTDGTGIINKVYQDMQALQEISTTFKRMAERDPAQATRYLNKYAKEIEQASLAGSFRQEMGELNAAERAVRSDQSMGSVEKRRFLDDIRKAKIELAEMYRQALKS